MVKDSDTKVLNVKGEGGTQEGRRARVSRKEGGPETRAEMRFLPPKNW